MLNDTTKRNVGRSLFRRRIATNEEGASAIEFAIVLPVLLLFLMGTIEYCYVFYLRGSIETVTHQTARMAMTGARYTGVGGDREAELADSLNKGLGKIAGLNPAKTSIERRVYRHLTAVRTGSVTGTGFGGSGEIVRYIIRYDYEFITPLANLASGSIENRLSLTSTVFIKNEVF